ncbi:hypothetical protein GMA19_04752 [Paenibacillus polymyxa E681]|nr:hypothetical protein GE561_04763 [Paenibacillus polymyxa E681]QNV64361.1 hypothetical protein GMA19_04752 [Paenibacillus polymyxa E681]
MNIGILGTGFGAYHASLLNNHPKVNRIMVFGRNETKLQKLKEELNVEVTQNIEDILLGGHSESLIPLESAVQALKVAVEIKSRLGQAQR